MRDVFFFIVFELAVRKKAKCNSIRYNDTSVMCISVYRTAVVRLFGPYLNVSLCINQFFFSSDSKSRVRSTGSNRKVPRLNRPECHSVGSKIAVVRQDRHRRVHFAYGGRRSGAGGPSFIGPPAVVHDARDKIHS